MAKKNKLATPEWIIEGYDSETDYLKAKGLDKKKKKSGKTFKIRKCPKCGSNEVGVKITGQECKGGQCDWECRKCGWNGSDVKEEELDENEMMKYLDEKEEEVA